MLPDTGQFTEPSVNWCSVAAPSLRRMVSEVGSVVGNSRFTFTRARGYDCLDEYVSPAVRALLSET